MKSPLVQINSATVEEIKELYGINTALAQRIVEYRDQHGYFKMPKDLEKVKGINPNLAMFLAPHIDWVIPQQEENTKNREWGDILSYTLIMLIFIYLLAYFHIPTFQSALEYDLYTRNLDILVTGSTFFINIILIVYIFLFIIKSFTLNKRYESVIIRIQRILIIVTIVPITTTALGNFIVYQFYIGWDSLLANAPAVSGMVIGIIAITFVLPLGIVVKYPYMIHNRVLRLISEGSILIGGPIVAINAVRYQDIFPIWMNIGLLLGALLLMWSGFYVLRTGNSIFKLVIKDFLLQEEVEPSRRTELMTMFNRFIPNEADQMILREALNEKYPPSKFRSFAGGIVLASGVWLLITLLTGTVDYFWQHVLNQVIPLTTPSP